MYAYTHSSIVPHGQYLAWLCYGHLSLLIMIMSGLTAKLSPSKLICNYTLTYNMTHKLMRHTVIDLSTVVT